MIKSFGGLCVGDRIINVYEAPYNPNLNKLGTVIGFHSTGTTVFVRYDDGSFGCTDNASEYKRLCKCCQCNCHDR
jgi:hypothetical protein